MWENNQWLIVTFAVIIIIMLLLDLGVFNKKSHEVSNKEAVIWSFVWISLSMAFSGLIYWFAGTEKFSQFQSAYWIEKSLSVDNLFVFILVFKFFDVANANKHKVLFWGIMGALVLRAIFIFFGTFLIKLTYLPSFSLGNMNFILEHKDGVEIDYTNSNFFKPNIILSLFGIFLIYAGIKSWSSGDGDDDEDYNNTRGAKLVRRFFIVSDKYVEINSLQLKMVKN